MPVGTRNLRFSFINYLVDGSVSASSETTEFPAENLQANGRPWKGWRSTATGSQTITGSFSSSQVGVVYLNNCNFAQATLTVGSRSIDAEIRFCAYCYRYQYAWLLDDETAGGPTASGVSVAIPSQTPVDGASYYRLGGLWAGAVTVPPSHYLFDVERTTSRPQTARQLLTGGAVPVKLGNPYARISVQRMARTDRLAPGFQDQLEDWGFIDYLFWQQSEMLMVMSRRDTADAYIVNSTDDGFSWQRTPSLLRAGSRVSFIEMVGP